MTSNRSSTLRQIMKRLERDAETVLPPGSEGEHDHQMRMLARAAQGASNLRDDLAPYETLTRIFNDVVTIRNVQLRLNWDAKTALPKEELDAHNAQIAELSLLSQEKISDGKVKRALAEVEKQEMRFNSEQWADIRAMKRTHVHEASLPAQLMADIKRGEAEGEQIFDEVKPTGDWEMMLPNIRHQLELAKKAGYTKANALGMPSHSGLCAYDGMLDQFSPGWTTKDYDALFDKLEPFLQSLLPVVVQAQAKDNILPIEGPFDPAVAEKLSRDTCERLGFNQDRGVMYFNGGHPMADGAHDDTRISARPDPEGKDFLLPLYDLMHEAGHGVYRQNTPERLKYNAAGQYMGMDIDESQSLMFEFMVGKSKAFSKYLSSAAQEAFGRKGDPALSADNLFNTLTRVKQDPVRISMATSEVTYMLHIILRYRIEKDLFSGKLELEDVPQRWNEDTEKMFGVRPKNNVEGCMQDVHWSCGYFGYFPSYAVGIAAAAQMFQAAQKAYPEIQGEMEKGNFKPLVGWLQENVHGKGSLLTSKQLIREATGGDLDITHLKGHLIGRYLEKDKHQPYDARRGQAWPAA